jgi:hypothetical protein
MWSGQPPRFCDLVVAMCQDRAYLLYDSTFVNDCFYVLNRVAYCLQGIDHTHGLWSSCVDDPWCFHLCLEGGRVPAADKGPRRFYSLGQCWQPASNGSRSWLTNHLTPNDNILDRVSVSL